MSEDTFSVGNAERTPSGLRNLAETQRALTTDDSWQAAVMEAAADRIEALEAERVGLLAHIAELKAALARRVLDSADSGTTD